MTECTRTREWTVVEVVVTAEMADAISDFFVDRGSGGVAVDDSDVRQVRIKAYLLPDQWNRIQPQLQRLIEILRVLFPDLPPPTVNTSLIPQENWATAWKDNFTSIPVGKRLVVAPPWIQPHAPNRKVVVIEPGEAFGTGTHETTQGCMELLEKAVEMQARSGPFSVLDVGCGSGILAIAAVMLGAGAVTAVDNDPVAIESARKNLELNRVTHKVLLLCQGIQDVALGSDIVLANLDPMALLRFRDKLIHLSEKYLIISGVPLDQWGSLKESFHTGPSRLVEEITRAEWGTGLYAMSV
jgi:ribosomal protein L11 methyltransferase